MIRSSSAFLMPFSLFTSNCLFTLLFRTLFGHGLKLTNQIPTTFLTQFSVQLTAKKRLGREPVSKADPALVTGRTITLRRHKGVLLTSVWCSSSLWEAPDLLIVGGIVGY
mmetsp:Transcript_2368/g.4827  ORF Transcript_2368/g.4827 Transcript_2368/m.4827 type:complete len:110 (+) Transcript_2368:550-879(+)